jgi:hypothetical protein
MFNIYLLLYIVSAIILIPTITYQSYLFGGITAVLSFLGATILFIIYGIRWFSATGALLSGAPVSWTIPMNKCPDYLTYYGKVTVDGGKQLDACIDLIGVSKNNGISKFPKDGKTTDPKYYFDITTTSSDTNPKHIELCNRTITAGLTWEGLTDGESCVDSSGTAVAPTPSGTDCPSV